MATIEEILATEDAYVEVKNAFAFSMSTLYLTLAATDAEEEEDASALLKINLSAKDPTYEILHRYDFGTLDYLAHDPDFHRMLAMGGYVHTLDGRTPQMTLFADMDYVPHLGLIDARTTAIFGDEGHFYRFRDGRHEAIPTGTQAGLQAMHFPRPDFGFVGGDYGTLLRWDGASLRPVDLGASPFIRALHVCRDGRLLLGCDDGVGMIVQDQEIIEIEDHSADFKAVTEFQGTEYWGDDDFGVYSRSGTRLIPRFETGLAFNLNATDTVLTINAGYDVYLYDGKDWIRIEIQPDPDRMVERVALDFTPR